MTQLYSDLADGSGRRYYFSLTRAPGGASPASQANLNIVGLTPTIIQQVSVFRNPATAALTLFGYTIPSLTPIQPGLATLTISGPVPVEQKIRVITPAQPLPDYSTPQSLAPTIIYIQTITPTPAVLSLQALTLNAFPGGDIVYVSPGVGQASIAGLQAVIINNQPSIGQIVVSGKIPSLLTEVVIQPGVATMTVNGRSVSVDPGFVWRDVISPPPLVWNTSTGVAA